MSDALTAFTDRIILRGVNDAKTIHSFLTNTKRQYKFVSGNATYNWWNFNGGDTEILVAKFSWKGWFRSGTVVVVAEHIQQRIERLSAAGLLCEEEQTALKALMHIKLSGASAATDLFFALYSAMEDMKK